MKNFRTSLHILLTFTSLLGFMGGWATLAHSRKPMQNTASDTGAAALEPLAPLPPLSTIDNSASNNNSGFINIAPQSSGVRSRRSFFATSGS